MIEGNKKPNDISALSAVTGTESDGKLLGLYIYNNDILSSLKGLEKVKEIYDFEVVADCVYLRSGRTTMDSRSSTKVLL